MADTGTSDTFSRIAQTWNDSLNQGDKEAFRSIWTDDALWESQTTGFAARGPDEIADWLWEWKSAFPDMSGDLIRSFGCGDNGVLVFTLSGTHEKDLHTPGIISRAGTIPASGKHATWTVCFVVTLRDDKVARSTMYFDILTMLSQIGAFPAAPRP